MTDINREIEALDRLMEDALLNEKSESEELQNAIRNVFISDIDSLLALIAKYKNQQNELEQEKQQYVEAQNRLKEISQRNKLLKSKYSVLEKGLLECINQNNTSFIKGSESTLEIKSKVDYVIDEEYVERIKNILPPWIKVEFKLDKRALKGMESIPEGVKQIKAQSLDVLTNLSETENEILERFYRGESIYEISSSIQLKWYTTLRILNKALLLHDADIHDFITDEYLDRIWSYHQNNPDVTKIMDFVEAFGHEISPDIMGLALCYLKIIK